MGHLILLSLYTEKKWWQTSELILLKLVLSLRKLSQTYPQMYVYECACIPQLSFCIPQLSRHNPEVHAAIVRDASRDLMRFRVT